MIDETSPSPSAEYQKAVQDINKDYEDLPLQVQKEINVLKVFLQERHPKEEALQFFNNLKESLRPYGLNYPAQMIRLFEQLEIIEPEYLKETTNRQPSGLVFFKKPNRLEQDALLPKEKTKQKCCGCPIM